MMECNENAKAPAVTVRPLLPEDALWEAVAAFVEHCSWRAGPFLARQMREGGFTDWERVFVALAGPRIAGYCTFQKTDCIPGVPYTPYIGFVFVDEAFRGNRLSGRMVKAALQYAGELGFQTVYLVSGEIGLYEKYGFVKIDEKPDAWGRMEQIFSIVP